MAERWRWEDILSLNQNVSAVCENSVVSQCYIGSYRGSKFKETHILIVHLTLKWNPIYPIKIVSFVALGKIVKVIGL